jgi:predicted amidohydrolase
MRVGFIQLNPTLLDVEGNVDRALRMLGRMRGDLVVLPELFNTGYNFRSLREVEGVAERAPGGFTTEKLREASADRHMMIVAGIAEKRRGGLFNSGVVVRNGRFLGTYRKIHLYANEKKYFKPGDRFRLFANRVGVMICFDWYYPESMRTLTLMGARVVAHPSNLVMPHCPNAMIVRCVENHVFAVTADRVGRERGLRYIGLSEIVDPNGRILHRASRTREEHAVRAIRPELANDKRITNRNDLLRDRMPRAYLR